MRILIFGKEGQVGSELFRAFPLHDDVVSVGRDEIDLTNISNLGELIRSVKPRVIINAAAYTDVERAESKPELAIAINGTAPGIMAENAKALDALLIHYSTDYVFDGEKGSPYIESDQPNPINVYGKSKLTGEQAIQHVGGDYLIFRTSWVYGFTKKSFATNVLSWAQNNRSLRIVKDQESNPTWCRMLAKATAQLLEVSNNSVNWLKERKGLYHLSGAGHASRFEFAKAIIAAIPTNFPIAVNSVLPASTQDFNDQAQRPKFSALDISEFSRMFPIEIPDWEESLLLALEDISSVFELDYLKGR